MGYPVAEGALRAAWEHVVDVFSVEGRGSRASQVDPPCPPLEAVHVHDGHADEAPP